MVNTVTLFACIFDHVKDFKIRSPSVQICLLASKQGIDKILGTDFDSKNRISSILLSMQ